MISNFSGRAYYFRPFPNGGGRARGWDCNQPTNHRHTDRIHFVAGLEINVRVWTRSFSYKVSLSVLCECVCVCKRIKLSIIYYSSTLCRCISALILRTLLAVSLKTVELTCFVLRNTFSLEFGDGENLVCHLPAANTTRSLQLQFKNFH